MKPSCLETISLTYVDGPRSIQIRPGEIIYWVDGIERHFRSIHSSDMINLVVSRYPDTILFKDMFEYFLAKYSIGSSENQEAGIHKIVHGLRQDLELAGLKMDLVRNVRSVGYRLAEGWKIDLGESSHSFIHAELTEIRKLVQRCVIYVHEHEVVPTSAGLYYLEAEPHIIHENFMIIDRIGRQILHSLGDPKLVPEILDIKRDLSLLLSYVVFWRVGHRITPELWREDFEMETTKILSDLELRIDKIKNHFKNEHNKVHLLTVPPQKFSLLK